MHAINKNTLSSPQIPSLTRDENRDRGECPALRQ